MGDGNVRSDRFIAGDPLRAIACLAILVWHFTLAAAWHTGVLTPQLKGQLGALGPPFWAMDSAVWLFFILSGYLLGGPFVRRIVRGDPTTPRIGGYARNRVLRIVPAFWVALTLTIVFVGTMGNTPIQTIAFYGFGHLYDNGPLTERMVQAWTLDVEAAFYVAMPLLLLSSARLIRGRWTPTVRATVIIAGLTVMSVASVFAGFPYPATGRVVLGSAWSFAPGIALAALEPILADRLRGRRAGVNAAYALVAVAITGLVLHTYVGFFHLKADRIFEVLLCGSLVAAPLVYQWSTGRCWRVLDNRFLHWVGQRSYGIYLIHMLVIFKLGTLIHDAGSTRRALVLVLPLALAISFVYGTLSLRFVERPFLERRAPWRSRRERTGIPEPVAAPEPELATAKA